MSDETQLERIYNKLDDLVEGHGEITERLARIETHWENHIKESAPLRSMVRQHDQSIQRIKGVGLMLSFIWTSFLAWLEYKAHIGR